MDAVAGRQETDWHALDAAAVFARLQSAPDGLDAAEAAARLQRFGPNRISAARGRGALVRFLAQFHNLLIYILLAAAAMTALLQHWVDTGVIVGVVLINAVIGYLQEGKAERAMDAIRNMLSQQAFVRRAGRSAVIDAEQLVPGDVVLLQAGDKVPADLRLFRVKNLHIDEAILTGESVPVAKDAAPVAADSVIGDRGGMAYSGTLVTHGQAAGVVVASGDATEIGRISTLLHGVERLTTPLLRHMTQFGRWLTAAILLLAGATFAFGTLARDYSAADMFLAAVGLAVAAIPEGLPAIMTITLAIGVERMARRNAIVRLLPAVETLGAVTVICTDKTGTLTRNEMTVQAVVTADGGLEVGGAGYDPHGAFRDAGGEIAPSEHPALIELCRTGLLCNEAELEERADGWRVQGDPTEGALVVLGMKAGLDPALEREEWPRRDVIPFESEHRFMATLHHDHAGHSFICIKGAPERLLEMCTHQRASGQDLPIDRGFWEAALERLAGDGQRTLALGFLAVDGIRNELSFADLETAGATLLGVVGMIDPPREEAVRAVAACRSAGVRVVMVTGDHAGTARAIGHRLGIGDGRAVMQGRELDQLDGDDLSAAAASVDVFARTSPEQKLRLVTALQARGEIVAMTGDGVNDAPALKRADVGVAMGRKGTEAAKEAAEMVLADDNFASITYAVEEGRTVYDNLIKAITFILPTNGGEAFTIIGAILTGSALPVTPVQILWINMVTTVTLALALAFEATERDVMRRPPRPPGAPILSRFVIWRILFVTAVMVAGTFGIFLWLQAQGVGIELARTAAVNTLVMFEIFYLFSSRYTLASALSWEGLFGNRYVLIAVAVLIVFQLLFTYAPPFQYLFGTAAMSAGLWGVVVVIASSVFFLVELEKFIVRRIAS
jgi:magnesium-transporting ATPase (P-type)